MGVSYHYDASCIRTNWFERSFIDQRGQLVSSDQLKIKCQCGQVLAVKNSAAGKIVSCPKCAVKLRVPEAAVPVPVAPPAHQIQGIDSRLDPTWPCRRIGDSRCHCRGGRWVGLQSFRSMILRIRQCGVFYSALSNFHSVLSNS